MLYLLGTLVWGYTVGRRRCRGGILRSRRKCINIGVNDGVRSLLKREDPVQGFWVLIRMFAIRFLLLTRVNPSMCVLCELLYL